MRMLRLLLGQIFWLVIVRCLCQEYYVGLIATMNGRVRDYALIANTLVNSMAACTKACFQNSSCVTFFYNSKTRQCQTHSVVLLKDPVDILDEHWRYYQFGTEKCSQLESLILFRKENTCYFVSQMMATWNEAKQECVKKGLRLVKITEKEVQDHFELALPQYPDHQYYFGLRSLDDTNKWYNITNTIYVTPVPTNKWVWSDSEIFTGFSPWAQIQSVQNGTTCVFLAAYQNRMWNNGNCFNRLRFVCEKII